jgi:hypothetical protein
VPFFHHLKFRMHNSILLTEYYLHLALILSLLVKKINQFPVLFIHIPEFLIVAYFSLVFICNQHGIAFHLAACGCATGRDLGQCIITGRSDFPVCWLPNLTDNCGSDSQMLCYMLSVM